MAIETVSFAQIATAATPKGAVLYGLTAGGAVSSRVSVDWSWLALFGGGPAGGRSDRIHVALAAAKHPLVHETVARVTCGRLVERWCRNRQEESHQRHRESSLMIAGFDQ